MEHKLGGSKAILVVSPLVALMEDQVYILKKHGVRASILGSSTSVAKENIATVECLGRDNFFLAPETLTTVKWRDAFEREGFSSRIVCQSGKFISDQVHHGLVNFRIIFNTRAS